MDVEDTEQRVERAQDKELEETCGLSLGSDTLWPYDFEP